jgi:penicillin amidase
MPIGSVYMLSNKYDSLGSNAWVVGGEHTKKGKPLLANDPHLGLLIPSLFYFVEFNLLDKNNDVNLTAFGAKPDGFPSLSIGVNNHFGWGSTAAYIDNKDVFHEIVQDNNGTL